MDYIVIAGHYFELERKRIKNINLRVYPAQGRLYVSAPLDTKKEDIVAFLESKISWIEGHLDRASLGEMKEELKFLPGECHKFLGKSYLLKSGKKDLRRPVELRDGGIYLNLGEKSSGEKNKTALEAFYREELKILLQSLVEKWEEKLGLRVEEIRIRKMKTRWGSCNVRERRIWINLELIKKDQKLIEYVLVHEMLHLIERGHNKRFYALMDSYLPQWRELKKMLK